jgi:hypothetical protein
VSLTKADKNGESIDFDHAEAEVQQQPTGANKGDPLSD